MNIEPYTARGESMQQWPALADWGKTLALNGNKLFFYDTGERDANSTKTKPAIFLIHGLGDEADSWRHILPLLAHHGYRVIAADLPGFGRSASPQAGTGGWKGMITIKAHTQAVLSLMRETGAASPERLAILAGSSLGAVIAEKIAGDYPGLVKSLILLDGCLPLSGRLDKRFLLAGLPFIGRNWYRAFRKNHEGAWKSLYPYYHNLDSMSAEDKQFLRRRVIDRVESGNQERAYFATIRSMTRLSLFGGANLSRRIKTFTGKILLLWGEADRVIPPAKTVPFRALRPDADLRIIPTAGHLPHQEAPEKIAAAMLRFLET